MGYATSYQVTIPFYVTETGEVLRDLYLAGWEAWAGTPVEAIVDPARTNVSADILRVQNGGVRRRVLTAAAEAHNQL